MSDIVKRLREAHPNSAQRFAGSTILLDAADEIERLQAAKDSPVTNVRVIPLEWVEHGDIDFVWHRAMSPAGYRYNIEDDGFSEKKHHLTVGQLVLGNFETLKEAQDAAHADYERRILSAIAIGASR
ncbi:MULTISPECIES: hypothetical protein [unclassified Rhizobium]|uniref:hypothetical protein n=1 Tax=unclassified Rhizobium TaxID=2613769 RepID=UPI001ADCD4F8|nr:MULTISPECIES: hypothetical protein [unclassified Rhizobium]MBO9099485.1 hypothetical protein [Rhizobium sp. L58/93]QXZ87033.1 hypothetical protein J5287_20805 [Rhizobium sp. K1/93]QXZ92933.1 hypothetical protein J5280_20090 [Rhizobium sp. K15/93]